jgi:hypothetical protein
MFDSLMNYVIKTFTGALGGNQIAAQSIVQSIFNGVYGTSGTVNGGKQMSVTTPTLLFMQAM